MNHRTLALLFFAFHFGAFCAAQQNFPGSVRLLDGTSKKGEIFSPNWSASLRKVTFYDENGAKTIYSAAELSGFAIVRPDGQTEQHEQFALQIDDTKITDKKAPAADLSRDRRPHFSSDTLLLKLLAKNGGHALYSHFSERGVARFFIQEGQKTPEELLFKYYWKIETDQQIATYDFRQQLSKAFYGCAEAVQKAANADYAEADLVAVFKTYFACKPNGEVYQLKAAREKKKFEFYVAAGTSLQNLWFTGPNEAYISFASFDNRPTWSARMGLHVRPVFRGQLLSASVEAGLLSLSKQSERITPSFSGDLIRTTISLQSLMLKVAPSARWNYFFRDKKSVYVLAGPTFWSALKHSYTAKEEQVDAISGAVVFSRELVPVASPRKTGLAAHLGIGYHSGRAEIELRGTYGHGIAADERLSNAMLLTELSAGFYF